MVVMRGAGDRVNADCKPKGSKPRSLKPCCLNKNTPLDQGPKPGCWRLLTAKPFLLRCLAMCSGPLWWGPEFVNWSGVSSLSSFPLGLAWVGPPGCWAHFSEVHSLYISIPLQISSPIPGNAVPSSRACVWWRVWGARLWQLRPVL